MLFLVACGSKPSFDDWTHELELDTVNFNSFCSELSNLSTVSEVNQRYKVVERRHDLIEKRIDIISKTLSNNTNIVPNEKWFAADKQRQIAFLKMRSKIIEFCDTHKK